MRGSYEDRFLNGDCRTSLGVAIFTVLMAGNVNMATPDGTQQPDLWKIARGAGHREESSLFAAGFASQEDGSDGTCGEDDRGKPHRLGHGGGEGGGLSR